MTAPRTLPQDGATTRRRRWSTAVGPGMVLGLVATVALVVSMFMSWQLHDVHAGDIPAAFLWDRTATGDPSLLVYLIPLAVVLGLGSLLRAGAGLRVLAGLLTVVVVGVYAYQLHELADSVGASFGDVVDAGFYVAAAAGVLGLVSGFVPTSVRTRRVERVGA